MSDEIWLVMIEEHEEIGDDRWPVRHTYLPHWAYWYETEEQAQEVADEQNSAIKKKWAADMEVRAKKKKQQEVLWAEAERKNAVLKAAGFEVQKVHRGFLGGQWGIEPATFEDWCSWQRELSWAVVRSVEKA